MFKHKRWNELTPWERIMRYQTYKFLALFVIFKSMQYLAKTEKENNGSNSRR